VYLGVLGPRPGRVIGVQRAPRWVWCRVIVHQRPAFVLQCCDYVLLWAASKLTVLSSVLAHCGGG
jgi:hypothetical protein